MATSTDGIGDELLEELAKWGSGFCKNDVTVFWQAFCQAAHGIEDFADQALKKKQDQLLNTALPQSPNTAANGALNVKDAKSPYPCGEADEKNLQRYQVLSALAQFRTWIPTLKTKQHQHP